MQSNTFSSNTSEQSAGNEAHWAEVAQPASRDSFCSSWLALQCGFIAHVSAGMVLLGKADTGPYSPAAVWPDPRRDLSYLSSVAEQALRERRGVLTRTEGEATSACVAYPLDIAGRIHGVVVLDIASDDAAQLRQALSVLHWGAGRLELMLAQEDSARSTEIINRLAMNLDLVAVSCEHQGFIPAARAFVTELASRLGCDRVSVGFRKGNHTEVVAISHSAKFKHKANLVRAIGAVMDEAQDQHSVVLYPEHSDETQPRITRYAAELVQHNGGGSVCALPLFDQEEAAGALVLESSAEDRFDASTVEFNKTIAALIGPILNLHRREEQGIVSRIFTGARDWLGRLIGPRHFGLKVGAVASLLLLAFLVFATGEYRITSDAALEGSILSAAVSPFEGYIESSTVRAGDLVEAGQVLCELNDKDLAVERQKWLSRRQQYARELREAKAEHEWSGVGILIAQNKQAEAELALLDDKLARTRITAPFDGIVVSGDLSQSLGAPVERGEVLFEVAPLASYRVVLEVDERDIEELSVGQRGLLSLASMPAEDYAFVIENVTPVATAAEGKNFFRVEAGLEEISERLRPGMEGVAKISIGERQLAWIWTHRIIDWFRLWFWSWWP